MDDPHENATWVYSYDRGGNILSKKRYALQGENEELGSVLETITYGYGDSNWKDKLTAFNGQTITYDAIGNPINDGTWTYTWTAGRQLAQMAKSGMTVQFKYNHDGLRTQKIVTENGVTTTTEYTYHGKLLTHMKKGTDELHFFYDAQSLPAMVEWNDAKYHYLHNVQGDIVGIIDSNGTKVVEYKYDAWGKALFVNGTGADTLGYVNALRYRGYVYDVEIEIYYVCSRYYNPKSARWNNADDTAYLGAEGINAYNLFAYCSNNPVVGYDYCGTFDLWGFVKGVGRVVTGVVAVAAGAVVCVAGAPMAVIVGAAITITAGGLTVVNGAADVQQSIAGNNFVRDSVFNGNQTAYDVYSSVTETVAVIGSSCCGNFIRQKCIMKGAVSGTESRIRFEPGKTLDRYGSQYGRYLTDPGTSADQLAWTPNNTGNLTTYMVKRPFTFSTGIVDSCDWGPGGGVQYFSWMSVRRLVQFGILVPLE